MSCPITKGAYHRDGGFMTTLMGAGTEIGGVIVANTAKILELCTRGAIFREKSPDFVVDEVHAKFEAVL